MGLVVLVVGVIGLGAVIGAIVVFAVLRRGKSGAGSTSLGAGAYAQNMGYPPPQPFPQNAQQPYPSVPNQGYSTPAAPSPQHPNPYAQ